MLLYKKELIKEGLTDDIAESIAIAVDNLHYAISKLDSENLKTFFNKSLNERLNDFTYIEEVRKLIDP